MSFLGQGGSSDLVTLVQSVSALIPISVALRHFYGKQAKARWMLPPISFWNRAFLRTGGSVTVESSFSVKALELVHKGQSSSYWFGLNLRSWMGKGSPKSLGE